VNSTHSYLPKLRAEDRRDVDDQPTKENNLSKKPAPPIRVQNELLSPSYLKWFLVFPTAQARIHSEKVDVARANFSLEDIRNLRIPSPPNRDDFWASTNNKQLNFLQHIFTILKQHGRAAVVLPDNVLFEGGAGETIRRELFKQAEVHTLLRLPTGIFYAQGVKANVLFFDRKPAQEKPWTEKLWIYDLRTNQHFTLKENTLKRSDLDDFVNCYFGKVPLSAGGEGSKGEVASSRSRHNRVETERFKSFTYEELIKRDKVNLDIFWLKDEALEESANLPAPELIAADIAADLEAALEQFSTIAEDLKK
jgi:type I restriction enzyme M protein